MSGNCTGCMAVTGGAEWGAAQRNSLSMRGVDVIDECQNCAGQPPRETGGYDWQDRRLQDEIRRALERNRREDQFKAATTVAAVLEAWQPLCIEHPRLTTVPINDYVAQLADSSRLRYAVVAKVARGECDIARAVQIFA